jgi:hypothetical protein
MKAYILNQALAGLMEQIKAFIVRSKDMLI